MPIFEPPTRTDMVSVLPETHGVQRRFWRYYGGQRPRGLCVVLVAGHYATIENPTTDQLEAAGNIDGVGFFLGGHVYTVSPAVAAALATDGYTTTADTAAATWGSYATTPWGEMAGYAWGSR